MLAEVLDKWLALTCIWLAGSLLPTCRYNAPLLFPSILLMHVQSTCKLKSLKS